MSSEQRPEGLAIRARNVTKAYRIMPSGGPSTTLREAITTRLRHPLASVQGLAQFPALTDVSFDIEAGGVVGVVGRNGAGKSTLLKVLTRITEIDRGEVDIWGRVGSLLEVGTGFHPELTGKENIYLNGTILGMSRSEVTAKLDQIVSFAEVGTFLNTPVKRYSSGMGVRLAFSVAAHLDAEILLVDEVLSVGDAGFQAKAMAKVEEIAAEEGRTVLLVSHNMSAVRRMCDRVIVLDRGRVAFDGGPHDAIAAYFARTDGDAVAQNGVWDLSGRITPAHAEPLLRRVVIADHDGHPTTSVQLDLPMSVRTVIRPFNHPHPVCLGIRICSDSGYSLATFTTRRELLETLDRDADTTVSLELPPIPFSPGRYFLDVSLISFGTGEVLDVVNRGASFDVAAPGFADNHFQAINGDGAIHLDSRWSFEQGASPVPVTALTSS